MADREATGGTALQELGLDELMNQPSTSQWLRDAIAIAMKRDPVAALSDAELLVDLLRRRLSVVELEAIRILRGP
ncbi:hypothetical protein HX798_28595 [Pseudomonas putida]|uniref:Uncharacterized protein n=1 Tax=Pseudomonas putida TaxID=303 RepID=A0A7Y8D665_PSEPU|nr:hypothetical protein [Pseudomonas putida]NWC84213.1 hypothetical protein [Pseudomonas putida]